MMGRPGGFAGPGALAAGPVGMAAPVGFGPGMRPPGPKLSGEVPMVISDFLAGKIAPGTTVRFAPVDPLEGGGGAGVP
jgi:hypothetical protein